MILMELTILVLVPSKGVSLDLPRPLYEIFILNFHKYLGNKGVKRRQHQVKSTRWSLQTSFINFPPRISLRPLTLHLALIVCSSCVGFLSLVVFSSSPSTLGLGQFLYYDVLVDLTLEC